MTATKWIATCGVCGETHGTKDFHEQNPHPHGAFCPGCRNRNLIAPGVLNFKPDVTEPTPVEDGLDRVLRLLRVPSEQLNLLAARGWPSSATLAAIADYLDQHARTAPVGNLQTNLAGSTLAPEVSEPSREELIEAPAALMSLEEFCDGRKDGPLFDHARSVLSRARRG